MENISTFNKGSLIEAYDGPQNKEKLPADYFRITFVYDIATGNRTVVTWSIRSGDLWDQGDSCCIP